jgi:hypothetical protein
MDLNGQLIFTALHMYQQALAQLHAALLDNFTRSPPQSEKRTAAMNDIEGRGLHMFML